MMDELFRKWSENDVITIGEKTCILYGKAQGKELDVFNGEMYGSPDTSVVLCFKDRMAIVTTDKDRQMVSLDIFKDKKWAYIMYDKETTFKSLYEGAILAIKALKYAGFSLDEAMRIVGTWMSKMSLARSVWDVIEKNKDAVLA